MTLRWEWTLPSGKGVAATLDPDTGVESVFLDGERVSSSGRGEKAAGHDVKGLAVVTFDPRSPICVLREPDGMEIAPYVFPTSTRGGTGGAEKAKTTSTPTGSLLVPLALIGVAGVFFLLWIGARSLGLGSQPAASTTVGYRAPNGRFVAHYGPPFTLKPSQLPAAMSGATLEDAASGDAIVIAAAPDASRDLWSLYQKLGPEVLVNVPRADGLWEEKERREGTCHGEPGAIVTGRVHNRKGEPARLWACTFVHDDTAYVVVTATRESTTARDEAKLRQIVDATDLTHLEDMSGPGLPDPNAVPK